MVIVFIFTNEKNLAKDTIFLFTIKVLKRFFRYHTYTKAISIHF